MLKSLVCVGLLGTILSFTSSAQAQQVTSDGSLNTTVTRSLNTFTITDGTTAGSNLFHSFQEFSIPTGGAAIFDNAPTVQNIFSRVTGGTTSNIDGIIRANGTANLFLLNPNGILFGTNAQLNLGGSFVATTADRLRFADQVEFSAVNPSPLLTISVPIGLQFGQNPGSLIHRAPNFAVQPGRGLALLGGTVSIEGGRLFASSGRIDVASLGSNGSITLSPEGHFSYPANQAMQDIRLNQLAVINASGNGGGTIQLQGRQIFLQDASTIASDHFGGNNPGGSIRITASDRLTLTDTHPSETFATNITARVRSGTGQGSSIAIATPYLMIRDGAQIVSRTDTAGNAGTITIQAQEIEAIGSSPQGVFPSGIISRTEATATGRGGDVTIAANRVQLIDGAEFRASSRGNGTAGNLTVRARELTTNSTPSTQTYTGISTSTRGGSGNGGDILLELETLNILGGSAIRTGTGGSGNAGNLTIRAQTVTLQGEDADGFTPQLFTRAESLTTTGNAGQLRIEADTLKVLEGSVIYTTTFGAGNAGTVLINARDVQVSGSDLSRLSPSTIQTAVFAGATGQGAQMTIHADRIKIAQGGQLTSTTLGSGNAGNITLTARSIDVTGRSEGGVFSSGIYANADRYTDPNTQQVIQTTGKGGIITIQADQLRVLDGADVRSSTSNAGNAGDINVTARTVEIAGSGVFPLSNFELPSALNVNVAPGSSGNGGRVTLTVDQVRLASGGQISSSTYGTGNGGDISIQARTINLIGISASGKLASGLYANAAQETGNGGSIRVNSDRVSISSGASINVGNFEPRFPNTPPGRGAAGEVDITARTVELRDAGSITVDSLDGDRGNISIQSDLLLMRTGSLITATSRGQGNGGNIRLSIPFIVGLENSDIIANAIQGRGGNIQITTQSIVGLQNRDRLTPGSDITASSEFGINGTVQINLIGVDPNSGLIELPANLIDPTQKIAQECSPEQATSFVITGRGGLPQTSLEPLRGGQTWEDLRDLSSFDATIAQTSELPKSPLLEATTWHRNPQTGHVELIAAQPALPNRLNCLI